MWNGRSVAWLVFVMLGECSGRMVRRSNDRWKQTIFYSCGMTTAEFYNVTQKSSRCECRMLCSVDPRCMAVTAVSSAAAGGSGGMAEGFECRTSTEPLILKAGLAQLADAVTFYKSEPQHEFYPSRNGRFYWYETMKKNYSGAKTACAANGGRLAITHGESEFLAAAIATEFAKSTDAIDHLMVDLKRESKETAHYWGDSVAAGHITSTSGVFEFNAQLGMGIMVDGNGLRYYKELDPTTENSFLCQYNPCGLQ